MSQLTPCGEMQAGDAALAGLHLIPSLGPSGVLATIQVGSIDLLKAVLGMRLWRLGCRRLSAEDALAGRLGLPCLRQGWCPCQRTIHCGARCLADLRAACRPDLLSAVQVTFPERLCASSACRREAYNPAGAAQAEWAQPLGVLVGGAQLTWASSTMLEASVPLTSLQVRSQSCVGLAVPARTPWRTQLVPHAVGHLQSSRRHAGGAELAQVACAHVAHCSLQSLCTRADRA